MKPSEAPPTHRAAIRRVIEQSRMRNPRVFGSVLHGEDNSNSDSDLDLLVDPLPGATLLDLGAVQFELEELLGVSVDVLTPGDLPAKFRDQILKEAALV
jgi:predicted nucleotidyltransferase